MNNKATNSNNKAERSKQSLRLWLRLLACESIIEQHVRTKLRESFSVTLPQFDVLAELEYAGKSLTMTELSNKLMVSNGNVTGVIDRLVREDYVSRVPSKKDRRVQLVKLTNSGLKTFKTIAKQHENWIAELFKSFSPTHIDRLTSMLTKANESLKKI